MTNAIRQIVEQYDTLGMSPAEIAEVEKLNETAVKTVLYANSAKYREAIGEKVDTKAALDYTVADEELANNVIRRVAQYSDNDATALKAAQYIKNERRGRNDVKAGVRRLNINVNVLNQHFEQAKAALASLTQPKKTIEI